MSINNKKDSYWFSHDSNAKDDPKCMLLMDQLGLEGYGIYWVLIEILRDQKDLTYPMALISAIAKRYGTSEQKVSAVVTSFGLFEINEEGNFYSPSLIERVLDLRTKQDARRAAALKANMDRWRREKEKKQLPNGQENDQDGQDNNPSGLQSESERNPNGVRTESDFIPIIIENNIKENNIYKPNGFCANKAENSDEQDRLFEDKQEDLCNDSVLTPEELVSLWNSGCGECSKVTRMTDKRRQKSKLRIKEFGKTRIEQLAIFEKVLSNVRESDFLQRKWSAFGFDWLIDNSDNWVKVYENVYRNPQNKGDVNSKWNR